MQPKTFTRILFACPACGQGEHHCDHLESGGTWGTWYCDHCGVGFRGSVLNGAPVDVVVDPRKSYRKTLVLLRLCQDLAGGTPVFLIVKGMSFDQNTLDAEAYFYNEHTCPTNYLGSEVKAIIMGDNEDPHGIFQWVATITPRRES